MALRDLINDAEERWQTARRVVSDDHPSDCPCVRDHLEVSFLHGMVEGEERAARAAITEPEPQDVVEARDNLTERLASTTSHLDLIDAFEAAIRADERTRWAAERQELIEQARGWEGAAGEHLYAYEYTRDREQQLVEERDYYLSLLEQLHRDTHDALADRRAALGEERTTDG